VSGIVAISNRRSANGMMSHAAMSTGVTAIFLLRISDCGSRIGQARETNPGAGFPNPQSAIRDPQFKTWSALQKGSATQNV
jgi:hypothetical protein